jgi:hypothetical protein
MIIFGKNNFCILILLFSTLVFVSLACGITTSTTLTSTPTIPTLDLVSTFVKQTVDALPPTQTMSISTPTSTTTPTPKPTPTTTPTSTAEQILNPPTGSISGMLTYPAEGLPRLHVVAFRLEDGSSRYIETASSPTILYYEFDLPVGTYNVVAYALGSDSSPTGLAGGYTNAVLCGLTVDCTDHSLIAVTVTAGSTTMNINPGDWYADSGSFPPMPTP